MSFEGSSCSLKTGTGIWGLEAGSWERKRGQGRRAAGKSIVGPGTENSECREGLMDFQGWHPVLGCYCACCTGLYLHTFNNTQEEWRDRREGGLVYKAVISGGGPQKRDQDLAAVGKRRGHGKGAVHPGGADSGVARVAFLPACGVKGGKAEGSVGSHAKSLISCHIQ